MTRLDDIGRDIDVRVQDVEGLRTDIATARGLADELKAEFAQLGVGDKTTLAGDIAARLDEAAGQLTAVLELWRQARQLVEVVKGEGGTSSSSPTPVVKEGPGPVQPHEPAPVSTSWFPQGTNKIPASWGKPRPNKKGAGYRWSNGQSQGVRIDKGDPDSPSPSQRVDHVIVRDGGVVIGRNGNPIHGSIKDDPVNAHIPLNEWKTWKRWNSPN